MSKVIDYKDIFNKLNKLSVDKFNSKQLDLAFKLWEWVQFEKLQNKQHKGVDN